jgi:hypothetical protein
VDAIRDAIEAMLADSGNVLGAVMEALARAEAAEAREQALGQTVARVEALVDEWEERAGEQSSAWRAFGPQVLTVPFAVVSLRAALEVER